MSQQAVSAIIIQSSARVPISWFPQKFRCKKIRGPLFIMTFPLLTVRVEFLQSSHFAKFVCLLSPSRNPSTSPPPAGPHKVAPVL